MSIFASPTLVQNVYLPVAVSMLPKAVGAGWRGWDVRNAPKAIKENTWRGEATVCGLVAANSVVLKQLSSLAKNVLGHVAGKTQSPLLGKALKLSESSGVGILAYVALACASNYLAEAVSREFFPREIKQDTGNALVLVKEDEDDDDREDQDDDSHDRLKREGQSVPRFQSAQPADKQQAVRHQPLAFAQGSITDIAPNPFRIPSPVFSANPAVAKPAFSI